MFSYLIKLTLVCVGSLSCLTATAEAFDHKPGRAVLTGFMSKHDSDKKLNEANHGIGYRSDYGYFVGYYVNSENRDSFYLGREFQHRLTPNLSVGLLAGAVTGYTHMSPAPLLLPELIFDYKKIETAVMVIPKLSGNVPTTVALQVRYKF